MNLNLSDFLQNPGFIYEVKPITQSLASLASGKCYTSYFILQNIKLWGENNILILLFLQIQCCGIALCIKSCGTVYRLL